MEIEKMLVLSTAHLTLETCNEYMPEYCKSNAAWGKGDYGYFVYVVDDYVDGAGNDLPADLTLCFDFAHKQGCCWVMFDNAAPNIEELPVHDW